jgi:hypothetical protein
MGRYLELLDRVGRERRRDKSDQSDQSSAPNAPVTQFERFCRFGRDPSYAEFPAAWNDAQEERAAFIEHEGGTSGAWAKALARLDPNKPPDDVPPRRWLAFIDDCGRFLDGGWAEHAAALGWGPFDLFGCDRERPFARVDHMGLLWLVNGGKVFELHRDRAILELVSGARQSYRRRPVDIDRVVLPWELCAVVNNVTEPQSPGSPAL